MSKKRKIITSVILTVALILYTGKSFNCIFAQNTQLKIQTTTPDNTIAIGSYTLSDRFGDKWEADLVEGSAIFNLGFIGIENNFSSDDNFTLYPNPVNEEGIVNLRLYPESNIEFIKVYNAQGKLLGMTETPFEKLIINQAQGIIFVNAFDGNNMITKKLMSFSNMVILKGDYYEQLSKKSVDAKKFTILYKDIDAIDPEYSDTEQSISIQNGEIRTIQRNLTYTPKSFRFEGKTSPFATVSISINNQEIKNFTADEDGILKQNTIEYPFSKYNSLPIKIKIYDKNALPVEISKNVNLHDEIFIDTCLYYKYDIKTEECSPGDAVMIMYLKNQVLRNVKMSNGELDMNFPIYNRKQFLLDSLVFLREGYKSHTFDNCLLNAGMNNFKANLEALPSKLYGNYSQPSGTLIELFKNNERVAHGVVDTHGKYLIDWYATTERTTFDSIKCSAEGHYTRIYRDITLFRGDNNHLEINLAKIRHSYLIRGSSSSPSGAEVNVYYNGLCSSGNVNSEGRYYADFTSTEELNRIDSITVSAAGYRNQKLNNPPVSIGMNSFNFNLEPILSHKLYGSAYLLGENLENIESKALKSLQGGLISITNLSNQTSSIIEIDENGIFDGEIGGMLFDSIEISFIGNSSSTSNTFSLLNSEFTASTGKLTNSSYNSQLEKYKDTIINLDIITDLADNYIASIQINGYEEHIARTTINDISGINLNLVTISDALLNESDFFNMLSTELNTGIYSYSSDSLHIISFLNDIYTQEHINTSESDNFKNAAAFIENIINSSELELVRTKKHTLEDVELLDQNLNNCAVLLKNSSSSTCKIGNVPGKWDYSFSHTSSESFNEALMAIAEGTLGFAKTGENGSKTNISAFTLDTEGRINGLSPIGEVAFRAYYLFPEGFFKQTK